MKILGRLTKHWAQVGPNDTHLVVGDDADLILMALVCYLDNLFVMNLSLNALKGEGYNITPTTAIFSTSQLHQQWATGMVHGSAVFQGVSGRKWTFACLAVVPCIPCIFICDMATF